MTNPEFFADVAKRAEALRQEVRERQLPVESRDAAELLGYYLREAHNKAKVIAARPEPQVAKAGA
jgi:hypothetical protein